MCINAIAPLKDKDGHPASVWSAVKFIEIKEKKTRSLVPASPELRAALGDKLKVNGTHTVELDGQPVNAVVFAGRASQVVETPKTEKGGVYYKVVLPMIISPIVGFFGGMTVMGILYLLLRNWRPVTVNRTFGRLQLASSAYMGFSHGMNDATKCMGIITLALVAATSNGLFANLPGWAHWLVTEAGTDPLQLGLGDRVMALLPSFLHFGYMPAAADVKSQGVPDWVVIVCALTMAAGTAAGGWRIIRTLGHKMVKLQPVHGFAAETTAATVLAVTGSLGHARFHHPRHHHQHHGRRRGQTFQRHQTRPRRAHRLGVGAHHSRHLRRGLRSRLAGECAGLDEVRRELIASGADAAFVHAASRRKSPHSTGPSMAMALFQSRRVIGHCATIFGGHRVRLGEVGFLPLRASRRSGRVAEQDVVLVVQLEAAAVHVGRADQRDLRRPASATWCAAGRPRIRRCGPRRRAGRRSSCGWPRRRSTSRSAPER